MLRTQYHTAVNAHHLSSNLRGEQAMHAGLHGPAKACLPADRQSSRKTTEAAWEKQEREWGMFVQAIIGQRVTATNGEEVMKIALVSFPLPPGVEQKGIEIIKSAMRGRFLESDLRTFNDEGTLIGYFSTAHGGIGESRKIISDLYGAAGVNVAKFHPDLSASNVRNFYLFQESRRSRLGILEADIAAVLSSPAHIGSSAWDTRFGGGFRQEWIYKGGKIYAPNAKDELIELTVGLANKDADFGHSKWLAWLIQSISSAYSNGANSFVGFHSDSTITVNMCAGSDGCATFYRQTMVLPYDAPFQYTTAVDPYAAIANREVNGNSKSSASSGSGNASSGGGQDSGNSSICPGCKKDKGVCSCKYHSAVRVRR